MKLIRSGGTNAALNHDHEEYALYGFGNYFMVQIKPELDEMISRGEEVAICVAAKDDKHHYDQRFIDIGFSLEDFTILGRDDSTEWDRYSAVLLLGGNTRALHEWLKKNMFSLDKLTQCRVLAGDSAGAYVLSGKTIIDYDLTTNNFEIVEGFIPSLNQLVIAHTNNTHYHSSDLEKSLKAWCLKENVEYIGVKENEINILEI